MRSPVFKGYAIAYLIFLYAPIVLLPLFAFNDSKVIAFPNPFHDEVALDIAAEVDGEALITVTDAVGKQLLVRRVQVEQGFTTEKLRLDAGLPRGLYIIKAQVGGVTQYIKMIKE